MTAQWLRQLSLIIAPASGQNGVELAELRVKFEVATVIVPTPGVLNARVYNLAPQTARSIAALPIQPAGATPGTGSGQILVRAGYPGNFGIIFRGNLVQTRIGRESPVDDYLDVIAQDGDWGYNWGFVNRSLAAGYTPKDVSDEVNKSFAAYNVQPGDLPDSVPQTQAPRGKAMFGMARDYAQDLARKHQLDWGVRGGQLQWLPQAAFAPGDTVELTSQTGMLGLPEQTQNGIMVRCLLNPSLYVGGQVRINNRSIQRAAFGTTTGDAQLNEYLQNLSIDADGLYKVAAISHVGDTRGEDWYSEMICFSSSASGGGPGVFGQNPAAFVTWQPP